MSQITVAALYQFTPFADFKEFHPRLEAFCRELGVFGILLLAPEGINGTVAGSREAIDSLKAFLVNRFDSLEYKESFANEMPFNKLRVRLKKEIVTLGIPVDPCTTTGIHVEGEEWNELISDPDVLVIDVRNDYEVAIGSFKGAQNPQTQTFGEFPDYVKKIDKNKFKKVAMCCTGGIRCEKASSYMLSQGFEEVFQLKGGILKYVETMPEEKSLWEGECFVFDNRVAIAHGLKLGEHQTCHGCRIPLLEEDFSSPFYERGVSCAHCYHKQTPKKRESSRQRQKQIDLARARGEKHLGATMHAGQKNRAGENPQP